MALGPRITCRFFDGTMLRSRINSPLKPCPCIGMSIVVRDFRDVSGLSGMFRVIQSDSLRLSQKIIIAEPMSARLYPTRLVVRFAPKKAALPNWRTRETGGADITGRGSSTERAGLPTLLGHGVRSTRIPLTRSCRKSPRSSHRGFLVFANRRKSE